MWPARPDYVYILVGTNNLVTQGNEESFLAYYERFIDMLREQLNPGVILYIQAIPGVQETVVQSKPGLDNARIATVNDLLANLGAAQGMLLCEHPRSADQPGRMESGG